MPTSKNDFLKKNLVFPLEKQCFIKKSLFEVGIDFGCHLGSNLVSFCFQILLKSTSKRHSKIDRFWLRFLKDLGSVLGPKLEPCWRQERRRCEVQPSFLMRERFSLIFRRLDPILAPCWLYFRALGPSGPAWPARQPADQGASQAGQSLAS